MKKKEKTYWNNIGLNRFFYVAQKERKRNTRRNNKCKSKFNKDVITKMSLSIFLPIYPSLALSPIHHTQPILPFQKRSPFSYPSWIQISFFPFIPHFPFPPLSTFHNPNLTPSPLFHPYYTLPWTLLFPRLSITLFHLSFTTSPSLLPIFPRIGRIFPQPSTAHNQRSLSFSHFPSPFRSFSLSIPLSLLISPTFASQFFFALEQYYIPFPYFHFQLFF